MNRIKYIYLLIILYVLLLGILFPLQFIYADEIIALSAVFFLNKLSKPIFRILLFVTIAVIFALLGNIIYQKQPYTAAVLLDLVTFYKFFLILIVGYGLIDKVILHKYGKRIIKHCKLLLIVCLFINILTQLNIIVFDFSSILNLYHPIALYSFSIYCLLSFLSKGNVKKYIIIPIVLGLLSGTSVATAYSFILFFAFFLFVWKYKKIKIFYVFIAIPFVIWLAYDDIYQYFLAPDVYNARSLLLINAFNVANDYFPLGSGFATYATSPSAKWYSKLYADYGLDNVHGLIEGNARFVSDTFYPAIIGETGYLGALCYIIALCLIVKLLFEMRNRKYSYIGLLVFLIPLSNSIANSSFFSLQSALPAFLIGVFLNYPQKKYNEQIKNNKINYKYNKADRT